MTSSLYSIFGSAASQLSARIETMRTAEAALMSFAKQFSDHHHLIQPNNNNNSNDDFHSFELFDTEISQSDIPLKSEKNCQLFCKDKEEDEKKTFVIHGVKVTSRLYNSKVNANENVDDNNNDNSAPLVLLHGYANGALYFYRNLLGLANGTKSVYALDMLGWGLSSRPTFEFDSKAKKTFEVENRSSSTSSTSNKPTNTNDSKKSWQTHATEQVYVESLEAWRKAHNIDKMTLGGHSMGGYLSVAYCEKYPQHVERLILISPAGVPDDRDADIEGRLKDAPLRFKLVMGLVSKVFDFGMTPSSFLRKLSEKRGSDMVMNYVERRLPSITSPDERKHLADYLYTNAMLPGSGEDCLNKILKPTTFAHQPLLHRIPCLKVKNVSFIYGKDDWMDANGGIDTMTKCNELRSQSQGIEKDVPIINVYGVRNAGHLLHLDNWREFNSAIMLASGRENRLASHAPRPFEAVGSGPHNFFMKPRWGKKNEGDGKGNVVMDDESVEGRPSTA